MRIVPYLRKKQKTTIKLPLIPVIVFDNKAARKQEEERSGYFWSGGLRPQMNAKCRISEKKKKLLFDNEAERR